MDETGEKLKNKGLEFWKQKNYAEAAKTWFEATQYLIEDHVLFANCSGAYAMVKDYKQSLAMAQRAIHLDPNYAKAYSRAATALYYLGLYEDALVSFDKAVTLDPDNVFLKKSMKKCQKAAQELKTKSVLPNNFGEIFTDPELIDKIEKDPKINSILQDKEFLGILDEIKQNKNSIQKYIHDSRIRKVIASKMNLNQQKLSEQFEKINSFGEPPFVDPFLTKLDQQNKEKKQQQQQQQEQKQQNQENEKENEKEIEKEKEKEEEKKKKKKVLTNEDFAIKYKKQGNTFFIKKKFNEALGKYEKALEFSPKNVLLNNNKAAVLIEIGEYEQAIEICEMCLELAKLQKISNVDHSKVLLRLANAYRREGDLKNACIYYLQALEKNRIKKTENILNETQTKLNNEIKELEDKKSKSNPKEAEILFGNAQTHLKKSEFEKAIECYTKCLDLNFEKESQLKYYTERATVYFKMNELHKSLNDWNYILLKLDHQNTTAYFQKSRILLKQKRAKAALAVLKKIEQLDPNNSKIGRLMKLANKIIQQQKERSRLKQERERERLKEQRERKNQSPKKYKNVEIQQIMEDPEFQIILQEIKNDPQKREMYFKNPQLVEKIGKLVSSGVISLK
ncbi:hsp70-hsp90 organizing protein 1-related [Anaeramoeba flamelloides]|uniref:Hsp70-hsp90 organizing protein 1-related n=1 Tax=Anaeramoeba flamelloides TaxID=1746091 RepID=A0AAV7ZZU3_9EUKA|nr:hsp70-hsp90 organizing protein 1-related [Anaeramoeba flamelloides]